MKKGEERRKKSTPRAKWLRIIGKIAKTTAICLLCIILLPVAVCAVAKIINGLDAKIKTENGVQEKIYVEIDNTKQYLYIRGEDKNNPVILFVHGGPGSPMAYTGYAWQTELEDSYTFVQWDQRGSGRTYYENPGSEPPTAGLLMSDMDAVVDYLRGRFGQQKIIVMGHSWGSILGTRYIKQHPEKVFAYIGVGQVINMKQGDVLAAEYAIKLAGQAANSEDAERIQACLDIYMGSNDISDNGFLENFALLRSLTAKYLPSDGTVNGLPMMWMGLASPDMSWRDMKWFLAQAAMNDVFLDANIKLLEECMVFDIRDEAPAYDVPVYFITGENDWITPASLAEEYFDTVDAPKKKMVVIKSTGHNTFIDNPEDFCETVKALLG